MKSPEAIGKSAGIRRTGLLLCLLFATPLSNAATEEASGSYAINDRIATIGVCEEYNLGKLSDSDKEFVENYYPVGKRCPAENRVGRCLGYTTLDGLAFDRHYYSGTAEGYDWQPSSIQVTCSNRGGIYQDG